MPGVVAQTANGRVNRFGIEVVSGLTWEGWEPGREYTKNIVLKNVKVKTQKLKYKVPATRFFSTLYPQPVVLSAGTSFTLPVTFRPLEKNVYEDKVEFTTNEGDFTVPIHALLPVVNVEAPEHINFMMCAALDFVQLTYEIKNASELVTPFHIDVQEPFIAEPSDGTLEPFGSCIITATFKPKAALVYEADAVCRYGPEGKEKTAVTRFEGIGKYPHLLVSSLGQPATSALDGDIEAVVNYGEVPIGQVFEKWLELHNLSPVNAPFRVDHPTGAKRIDTAFDCPQKHGVVPANSVIKVPITFSPNCVGTKSIDYFHVVAIGNISKTVIKCVGSCKGPKVRLSKDEINFFQINAGETATKTVDIINESDMEASFQFMIDCSESAFEFEYISGTLPANSQKTIILQFQPTHPINYYRRVVCLVHNQNPVFLDLVGTCHTETAKPAVLQVKHLHRYRTHVERGFSMFPPEQLNEMLREGKLQLDDKGALMNPKAEAVEGACSKVPQLHPMDEYFNDGYYSETTHTTPHVSMDVHQVDFGQCTDMRIIEQQTINITNHTKGKITIAWMGANSHVFVVSPATLDIPPEKSSTFQVTFRPGAPNQFYGAELECYAYYKSMRDYRLVEDTTHCPPWCLNLTCTGHTFMPNNETFLPKFALDTHKLVFPAVNASEPTYRTVQLTNIGTTPILFDFEKDNTGIFSIKPTKGLLHQGHQMFVIKIVPKEVKTYKQTLKLRLNDADKNTQEIVAYGSAESAEVLLDSLGVLYFKPTCVGTASHRKYGVKNISRIPLMFEWKMNHADAKLLSVSPSSGIIQPNELQYHTWSCVPQEQVKSVMKPCLIVCGQGQSSTTSAGKKRQFLLRVVGEGSLGEIKAEQSYIEFGTVVVGSISRKHIVLYNEGNCSLHYKLNVEQSVSGPYPDDVTRHDSIALELDQMQGVLPARSKHVILGTVRPSRRVYYQFSISYTLLTPEGDQVNPLAAEPVHLCHVLATGVFPTMAVTDARCYGSAINISKKQLWNLFSIDNLNVCLDSDPSAAELMYTVATRHSHKRRPPVYTRAIMDFNFSAAPLNSEPCVVQLMVENTGAVSTEWAFLFPSDLQLELEYWAETGEFDEDELHEMKVMDNRLFDIQPRKGKLEPGECQSITFTYNHIMAGTDRLPVLLKLTRGREILLNFVGVTVEPDRRYIHFPSSKFMFAPVAVGEKTNPIQVYELYNGGALPVKYEIDITPLELVKQENYEESIFECLNPMGEILPGRSVAVRWKFSPLEPKTYMVDVPVHIHNGDTAIITFTGIGYDKRIMGETMPVVDQTEISGVPAVQSVSIPGQLVYLSQERVLLGNLPLYSQARRVLDLTNKSPDHRVSFEWHVTTQKDSKFVSISPTRGTLQPGEGKQCKVAFTACDVPSFYDIDLVCEVTDETVLEEYEAKLAAWEAELLRQQYEFTVTEEDLDADQRLPDVDSRPPSGRLKSLEASAVEVSDTDFAKYKTLPPIKQSSIDDIRAREKLERRFAKAFWEKPERPEPFLLHLGVTARTHDITEFQQNFPDEYHNFYVDRLLSDKLSGTIKRREEQAEEERAEKTSCIELESEIVAGTLGNIIRGLLDDADFHDAVRKLDDEPIPYMRQFGERPPTAQPPSITPEILVEDFEVVEMPEADAVMSPRSATPESMAQLLGAGAEGDFDPELTDRTPTPQAQGMTSQGKVVDRTPTPKILSAASEASGEPGPVSVSSRQKRKEEEEKKFAQRRVIKKLPELGNMVENLLENTLTNIMQEAFAREFNITARPRLVALLPKPTTPPCRSAGSKRT